MRVYVACGDLANAALRYFSRKTKCKHLPKSDTVNMTDLERRHEAAILRSLSQTGTALLI